MTTDRDKMLDKIKKCLALAKSANEHEAAIALRQAHALMREHGISAFDVEHSDIEEEAAGAGAARRPPSWEAGLATRIADAFDCDVFLEAGYPCGRWVFVGPAPAGQIARYAFDVLFRQAKRARVHYMKTALKRCTTTRTRRADTFCEGWVMAATALVDGTGGNAATQARIAAYLEHKHELRTFKPTNRNAGRKLAERDYGDLDAGYRQGKDAQLNKAVSAPARPALLG
ncbi:hypothetical protein ANDA3_3766 [plant metagenome]|uniref:Uncharacterized protein n=1 Tax=plant metagenome TaxID=1297885 RepID=A0A484Q8W3_9ZZZZ